MIRRDDCSSRHFLQSNCCFGFSSFLNERFIVERKINQHSARLTNEQRKKYSVGVDEKGLEICKCLVGI